MKRLLLLALLLLPAGLAQAATALPGDSVYHVKVVLTDQDGASSPLAARRGRAQLVTMFYSSCQMVCPMIIDSLRATRNALTPAARAKVDLLAVSFDPARDSVPVLKDYAEKRKLSPAVWTLARTEPAQARLLSGVLGLQYRLLPDGEFNHSSELILLDAEGRIVARTNRIGKVDQDFLAAVEAHLASH